MSIQLQVGKSYRNRLGDVVEIVNYVTKRDSDPYPYEGNNGRWYTSTGTYYTFGEDDWDLIEEYTTETTEKEQFKFELDDVVIRDKVSYIVIGRYKDIDSGELFYALTCVSTLTDVDVPIEQVHEQFKIVS